MNKTYFLSIQVSVSQERQENTEALTPQSARGAGSIEILRQEEINLSGEARNINNLKVCPQ